MNRTYLASLGAILVFGITLALAILESLANRSIVAEARKEFATKYRHEFQILTNSVRNDLLQNNYRYARNSLRRSLGTRHIEYLILPDAGSRESSENFESVARLPDKLQIDIPVYFGDENSERWGRVVFALPLTELASLSQNLESQLIWRSLSIALVVFFGFFLAFRLLWWTTTGIHRALDETLKLENQTSHPLIKKMWGSSLVKMATLANEHAKMKKDVAISQIAKSVAHDIRSPVSALQIVAKKSKGLADSERELIERATHQINSIANDLLDLSRTAAANSERVDLRTVIHDVVELKRAELSNVPNLKIEAQCKVENQLITGASDLKRIISNLMNNSLEAMPHGGLIKVLAESRKSQVCIEVEDTGCGMSFEMLESIRARKFISGKKSGNALGLLSAIQTVESWKGTLTVESLVGKSTTVRLMFPVAVLD